jgi:GNAT superfamily N-acetyltransferase
MAENGRIRRAEAADIPVLIDIIHRTIESYGYIFELEFELADFLDFDAYYSDGKAELYVIEHDGVVAGCGALKLNGEIPYLSRIYVDEVYRGNGYGKAIVLHLMRRNVALGHVHLELWSDTRFRTAHALYEKLGYVFTGRVRPLGDINNCFEYHYVIDPAQNPYLISEFRIR